MAIRKNYITFVARYKDDEKREDFTKLSYECNQNIYKCYDISVFTKVTSPLISYSPKF